MADQFIALIKAELDTKSLENKLKNFKPSTPVEVDIKPKQSPLKIEIDKDYIQNQIQSALQDALNSSQSPTTSSSKSKNTPSKNSTKNNKKESNKSKKDENSKRTTQNTNKNNNQLDLTALSIKKAKERNELNRKLKEIQNKTDEKVTITDVRAAKREIDKANKEKQSGSQENIKLRRQNLNDANMKAKEDASAKRRKILEEKVKKEKELAERENVRKEEYQTFKETSSSKRQKNQERSLETQSQKVLKSSLNSPEAKIKRNIENEVYDTDIEKLEKQFQEYGLSVDEAKEKTSELRSILQSMGSKSGNDLIIGENDFVKEFEKVNVQLEKAKSSYNDNKSSQNKSKNISDAVANKTYDARISTLDKQLQTAFRDTNVTQYDNTAEAINKVKDAYEELKTATDAVKANNTPENIENQAAAYDKLETQLRTASNEMKILTNEQRALSSIEKNTAANKIAAYYNKNTRALKKYGDELKNLEETAKNATDRAELNNVMKSFGELQSQISAEGLTGQSWGDIFSSSLGNFSRYFSAPVIIEKSIDLLIKMVEAVYEIDTAMTQLYKVTDEVDSKYDSFLSNAGDKAQELGRDMSSYINQTATWAKLGYSLDKSADLAQVSSIYANVGEVDDETAVSDIVTTIKAFDIDASDSITVVDKLNKLGNEFATSSADLGTGLTKSASAMATAGTDINKTLAMLTGGTEITQNASEFGNFLKVGSMRIRGMKGELEELGEEVDDSVDSISKVQTQVLNLTKGKVNIFDNEGQFKDYYDIMKDVSEIYDSLSSTDQASLMEILFGKQRGNQGAALIQAFQSGQIEKAYEAALNSEGSAQKEQDRWLESMEAKVAQFQGAFQELSNVSIDSSFLKGLVDAGTDALNVISSLIEKVGILIPLVGAIGGRLSLKENGLGRKS